MKIIAIRGGWVEVSPSPGALRTFIRLDVFLKEYV